MEFDSKRFEIRSFVASSVLEAADRIRSELGPDAIVLDIRQVKPEGIAKLWRKPRIEVLVCKTDGELQSDKRLEILEAEIERLKACLGEKISLEKSGGGNELKTTQLGGERGIDYWMWDELGNLNSGAEHRFTQDRSGQEFSESSFVYKYDFTQFRETVDDKTDGSEQSSKIKQVLGQDNPRENWKARLLENIGIEASYIPLIIDQWQTSEDFISDKNIRSLIDVLEKVWSKGGTSNFGPGQHFFVGPSGSGKSTIIGKIASRLVLKQSAPVSVVRLDGIRANISELPGIYSEILGIPCLQNVPERVAADEYIMIDLPGVDWQCADSLNFLTDLSKRYANASFHLVLNLCYETRLLFNQIRAFRKISNLDLIFTHIDEETRLGKLLNFKLGTNYTVSFLSGGQNIPGFLEKGNSKGFFRTIFPSKLA